MNGWSKRSLFGGVACGFGAACGATDVPDPFARRQLDVDGVVFSWAHDADRVRMALAIATAGWIAVGFNDRRTLAGTRFVIASAITGRIEERIARVPDHAPIAALGIAPAIAEAAVAFESGRSVLRFAMPHRLSSQSLAPGSAVHLMLAWSPETDFAHHSAWRRHVDVVL